MLCVPISQDSEQKTNGLWQGTSIRFSHFSLCVGFDTATGEMGTKNTSHYSICLQQDYSGSLERG